MKLFRSRTSRAEDRIEVWINQRHQERVLSGQTVAAGPCPDETFLRALARKSHSISLADGRIDHASTCPICMRRLLVLRTEYRSQQRRLRYALAGGTCVILIAALVFVPQWGRPRYQVTSSSGVVSR